MVLSVTYNFLLLQKHRVFITEKDFQYHHVSAHVKSIYLNYIGLECFVEGPGKSSVGGKMA